MIRVYNRKRMYTGVLGGFFCVFHLRLDAYSIRNLSNVLCEALNIFSHDRNTYPIQEGVHTGVRCGALCVFPDGSDTH